MAIRRVLPIAALGVGLAFASMGPSAYAKVIFRPFAEQVRGANRIVVARVVGLNKAGPLTIARAVPEVIVKGPEDYRTFYFLASGTWTCDISHAERGERALLFLHPSKQKVHLDLTGQPPSVQVPFTPLYSIGEGRLRLPILTEGGVEKARLPLGDVPPSEGEPYRKEGEDKNAPRVYKLNELIDWIRKQAPAEEGRQVELRMEAPAAVRPGVPFRIGVSVENTSGSPLYLLNRIVRGEYLQVLVTDSQGREVHGGWEHPFCPPPPTPEMFMKLEAHEAISRDDLESRRTPAERTLRLPRGVYRISVSYCGAAERDGLQYPEPRWQGRIYSRSQDLRVEDGTPETARLPDVTEHRSLSPVGLFAELLPDGDRHAPLFRVWLINRTRKAQVIRWAWIEDVWAEALPFAGGQLPEPIRGVTRVLPSETASVLPPQGYSADDVSWFSFFRSAPPRSGKVRLRFACFTWPDGAASALKPLDVCSRPSDLEFRDGRITAKSAPLPRLECSALAPGKRLIAGWDAGSSSYVARLNGKRVASPKDLRGAVRVRTAEQALERVRLFSGPETHWLFGGDLLEVHVQEQGTSSAGAIEQFRWEQLGIPEATVRKAGESYNLSRPLLRYPADPSGEIELLVSRETVGVDGSYELRGTRTLKRSKVGEPPYLSVPYY